jgi:hypothetical protein
VLAVDRRGAVGLVGRRRERPQDTGPAAWQSDRERLQALIAMAETFTGGTNAEVPAIPVPLPPGEHALLVLPEVQLIEPRRLPGHFMGGNAGFTFPVTRTVHAGDTGTGDGDAQPVPIDTGVVTVTDRRVVFSGPLHARTWDYASVLGYHNSIDPPWTAIPVSDRQRVSGLRYGEAQAEGFRFALTLGMARFHGSLPTLVADLRLQLDEMERERPAGSGATRPAAVADTSAGPAAGVPPGWYPDPYRMARLRWWDGRAWTGHAAP